MKGLDLYCGAGGAGAGYVRAGFDMTGVDVKAQPHYPYPVHQAGSLAWLEHFLCTGEWPDGERYDFVHSSPPCQAFSHVSAINGADAHDFLTSTRSLLSQTGLPYIIENVPGAPMPSAVVICGSGLGMTIDRKTGEHEYLRRHRLFESNIPLMGIPCSHNGLKALGVYGGGSRGERHNMALADEARELMEMPWATLEECCQAIPPAYTEFVGGQLMEHLTAQAQKAGSAHE